MKTKIIGLGHYSRVGKDELANRIIEGCKAKGLTAKKVSLSWELKRVCHQLYGWAGLREPDYYETPEGVEARGEKLTALSSEVFPDGLTPVEMWIAMGTEAVRNNVFPDTWVKCVTEVEHDVDVLVIPDVRFENEVRAVRERGGWLIKVVRPGYVPRDSPADLNLMGYDGWDAVVGFTGTLDHLQVMANKIVASIGGELKIPEVVSVLSKEVEEAALVAA